MDNWFYILFAPERATSALHTYHTMARRLRSACPCETNNVGVLVHLNRRSLIVYWRVWIIGFIFCSHRNALQARSILSARAAMARRLRSACPCETNNVGVLVHLNRRSLIVYGRIWIIGYIFCSHRNALQARSILTAETQKSHPELSRWLFLLKPIPLLTIGKQALLQID